MKGHGEKLSRKQEQAVAALLAAGTIKAAAQNCGISEVTMWRWLQQTEFVSRYRGARQQVVESAISELQVATSEAVATLRRNLKCGNASVENRAAQLVMEYGVKGVELLDMEERIATLEQRLSDEKEMRKWA